MAFVHRSLNLQWKRVWAARMEGREEMLMPQIKTFGCYFIWDFVGTLLFFPRLAFLSCDPFNLLWEEMAASVRSCDIMQVSCPFHSCLFFILMQLQQSNPQVRSSLLANFGQRSVHVFLANSFQSNPWFAFCGGLTSGIIWNSCIRVITWGVVVFVCLFVFSCPSHLWNWKSYVLSLEETIKWYSGTS